MTQEERELLIKDLCSRLPDNPIFKYGDYDGCDYRLESIEKSLVGIDEYNIFINNSFPIEDCKPYLRPLESMTEEEAKELFLLHNEDRKELEILKVSIGDKYIDFKIDDGCCSFESHTIWYEEAVGSIKSFDWLNKKMFDYRGLIPMGLALLAPEGMYNE